MCVQTFKEIRELDVCPEAECPLTSLSSITVEEAINSLMTQGITNISFFAIATTEGGEEDAAPTPGNDMPLKAEALPQVATTIEEESEEANVRYLWQPPVAWDKTIGLAELIKRGPRCSGDVSIRVEFDGSVIPPRGPQKSAGNLLTQPWSKIWEDDSFKTFRELMESPDRCDSCPGLAICSSACPKDPAGWATP
jgi:radical SAM protein with 4Fe4S-binding SPASM domain